MTAHFPRVRKPRRLSRKTIYRNPWVNLHVDRVIYPGGRLVPHHHVLDFALEAAGALVTNEKGQILLVHVYRYVTDEVQWEIPAGRSEKGENPLRTARRETREESGYETTGHRLIYRYFPMNGIANQVFNVVRCRATRKVGDFDPSEIAAAQWFTRRQILRLLKRNQIRDGFSLVALLFYLNETAKRRQR